MSVAVDCSAGEAVDIRVGSINGSLHWNETDGIEEFFNVVIKLVKNAGKMVRSAFSQKKNIDTKLNGQDLVTETDQAVENMLISSLKERFPTHRFIGEESVSAGNKCELTDHPTWIIDPIDGTNNFVHGNPCIAISIGLAVKKELVMGIVYYPIQERLYSAKKGQGAYCNTEEVRVSGETQLENALVYSEFGAHRDPAKLEIKFGNMYNVIMNGHGIRAQGSAALDLCGVACGEADAYAEYGIHVWDIAAGILIVNEAGGVIMDPDTGGKVDLMSRRILCASSWSLANQLKAQIKSQTFPSD